MQTNYIDGRLQICLSDILNAMDAEQKKELIESMSCDGQIVEFVAQQIIDKWTENGYYSGVFAIANADAWTGLDKAWRSVAKASSDVAKREIERLEDALRRSQAEVTGLHSELFNLRESRRPTYFAE
jgi:hypothetical protein